MKIGIDSRGATLYKGTGIGTYTNNLVIELLKNCSSKDNFTLFCCGNFNNKFITSNSKIIYSSNKHGSFYEQCYFPEISTKLHLDLFHIPQNGLGLNVKPSIPTIVTIHDLIPYIMPETVGKGYLEHFLSDMPYIIKNSSAIITVSQYSKKDILRFFPYYPAEKIFVIPLAANKIFKPLNKIKCLNYVQSQFKFNNKYILYLGGFSSRKNVLRLLKSFSMVYKNLTQPYTLLIAGSPKDEGMELMNYVSSNNLESKIIFTDFINTSLLPVLYNGCDAFVYPSLYEGFGLPPLEAMSCKTPVITSDISSIPEVTGSNAVLINPYNENSLAESMEKLLNDENLKLELSLKGYNHSHNFTWQQTALKTLSVYNKVLRHNL